MVPPPHSSRSRSGTFSPAATAQSVQTGISHSPHPSQTGPLSAGASPSTSSPTTGSSSLTKIVVAQVYLLLSTIKEGDKWDADAERIRNVWPSSHRFSFFNSINFINLTTTPASIFTHTPRPTTTHYTRHHSQRRSIISSLLFYRLP